MRSLQTLGLSCIAAFNCTVAAENGDQTVRHPGPGVSLERSVSTSWQPRPASPRNDRLGYLNRPPCPDRLDCPASRVSSRPGTVAGDYIDSLSLGSYGPMKFKFTGDRVKLKVRF